MPRATIAITVCLLGLLGAACMHAQNGDVAVVVNQNNPVSNLSRNEVRKLFAGERKVWSPGLPVKIFVRAQGASERLVLLALLDMSESEYKQYWISQVLRKEARDEPVALFSNAMQRQAIEIYPGAIALVNVREVAGGMKVVRVDGRAPGDKGYPLSERRKK
jgi:hypothetical protein